MKPSESNTLRGAVLALMAALVALAVGLLVMFEVLDAGQAVLVTGLVAPVLGGVGALWAAWGRYNPGILPLQPCKPKPGPRGGLVTLVLLCAILGACGSTFLCEES